MFTTQVEEPVILRPEQVCQYLGISRSGLYYLHEKDPTFPRKIKLSPRMIAWRKESLDAWLKAKEQGDV